MRTRLRGVFYELLKAARLQQLPLVLEVAAADVMSKGAMGRFIEEKLKGVLAGQEEEEEGDVEGIERRPVVLPKAPKRIKVVGRKRLMGVAVLKKSAAGLHHGSPRAPRPSKLVASQLRLMRGTKVVCRLVVTVCVGVGLTIFSRRSGITYMCRSSGRRTGRRSSSRMREKDESYVSCSAIVAVLSLLLQRPVPSDVVVLAECRLGEYLEAPRFPASTSSALVDTLLSLAKANGITRVMTTPNAAGQLNSNLSQHQRRRYEGSKIAPVASIVDVIRATWDINT